MLRTIDEIFEEYEKEKNRNHIILSLIIITSFFIVGLACSNESNSKTNSDFTEVPAEKVELAKKFVNLLDTGGSIKQCIYNTNEDHINCVILFHNVGKPEIRSIICGDPYFQPAGCIFTSGGI